MTDALLCSLKSIAKDALRLGALDIAEASWRTLINPHIEEVKLLIYPCRIKLKGYWYVV